MRVGLCLSGIAMHPKIFSTLLLTAGEKIDNFNLHAPDSPILMLFFFSPATDLAFSPINDALALSVGLDKRLVCCDSKV